MEAEYFYRGILIDAMANNLELNFTDNLYQIKVQKGGEKQIGITTKVPLQKGETLCLNKQKTIFASKTNCFVSILFKVKEIKHTMIWKKENPFLDIFETCPVVVLELCST